MKTALAVATGGALGSVLRYGVGRLLPADGGFAWGTLAVNVVGCAIAGALAAHFVNEPGAPVLRAALVVGFCGGLTTFSAFSLETVGLLAAGSWGRALGYIVASVAVSVAAAATSFHLVSRR